MSRVTAAFVCALCDPDNPRPASIMCSNNCGRYVCAVHAMPRKGPGSAMICLSCAEALGLLEAVGGAATAATEMGAGVSGLARAGAAAAAKGSIRPCSSRASPSITRP